jgi:asparagine synthase (glutamine-hydrolysing)
MCGIVGILDATDTDKNVGFFLRQMTDRIKHRGPDSDGFYCKHPVGLGMRRLSIIDLNTGDQPISNEDGTIWVVFNGEIYNYIDLRKELILKGHFFKTLSDTEVIIHQYEEDGEGCAEKFRGMFTIAIWDSNKNQLILIRDRFGIKPLYVAEQTNKLAFASEMKALFSLSWIDYSWNPIALRAYLSLGYIPSPLTVYGGIRKFRPGTSEVWNVDAMAGVTKIKTNRYWSPSLEEKKPAPSYNEASDALLELLKESVRIHLRSDVPLGAFLSGGTDSSAVVALMRLCGVQDIKTFSIGFDNEKFNELNYAEQVAHHLGTEHYSHTITGAEAQGLIPLVQTFDEPYADSSAIPTYFVSRFAREQVTVSLSGDGGDELFAGYLQYPRLERYRFIDWIPHTERKFISNISSQVISERNFGGGFIRRLGASDEERYLSFVSTPVNGYIQRALSSSLSDFLSDDSLDAKWQSRYLCNHSVREAQIIDQNTYLPDDILTKVDISSMAVSLEARVPLLDHILADYVNSLPTSFKLKNGNGKLLFKQVIAPYLPKDFLNRPKSGFAIPLQAWLTGPLRKNVQDLLRDDPASLFNPTGIAIMLDAMETGKRAGISSQVWTLLCLSIWANNIREQRPF